MKTYEDIWKHMKAYENIMAQVISINTLMAAKGSVIALRYSSPSKSLLYISVTRSFESSIINRMKPRTPTIK